MLRKYNRTAIEQQSLLPLVAGRSKNTLKLGSNDGFHNPQV